MKSTSYVRDKLRGLSVNSAPAVAVVALLVLLERLGVKGTDRACDMLFYDKSRVKV